MEIAKISSKGQITIPISIRNKLKLKSGDKDFLVLEIKQPRIMTMVEFIEKY